MFHKWYAIADINCKHLVTNLLKIFYHTETSQLIWTLSVYSHCINLHNNIQTDQFKQQLDVYDFLSNFTIY